MTSRSDELATSNNDALVQQAGTQKAPLEDVSIKLKREDLPHLHAEVMQELDPVESAYDGLWTMKLPGDDVV